jgi:glycosyltransferase involved in cell wall biosynthesis
LASLNSDVKVIFTEHGRFYPEVYKWKRVLINPLLARRTDAITAISEATRQALIKYERLPASRIEVIYNGLQDHSNLEFDLRQLRERWGIGDSDRVLGTISRLDPIKNQRLMLEAFRDVRRRCDNVKLIIVGDGPLRQELEEIARNLGIYDDVIFTGFQVEPYSYIKLIDIFLLSSLSEGTSMTLLEAMSFSKPCVATDVGGNPEIVLDGETGFVTPDRDTKRFSDGIIKLLENPVLMGDFGAAARQRFEQRFSLEKMVDAYQELYSRI